MREGGSPKPDEGRRGEGAGENHPDAATKSPDHKSGEKQSGVPRARPPQPNRERPHKGRTRTAARPKRTGTADSGRKDAAASPSEQTTRRREPLRIWDACKRQFCAVRAQKKRLLCPAACGKIDMVGFCAAAPAGLANPPPVSTIGERRAARLRTWADSKRIDEYSGKLQQ